MARRLAGGLVGVVCIVLALHGPAPLPFVDAQAILHQLPAEATGRLVLPRNRELWQVTPSSGSEQRVFGGIPLTTVTQTSWSPDGQQIAWSQFRFWRPERPPGSDLMTMRVGDTEPTVVLPAVGDEASFTEPVWGADGRSLVYTAVVRVPGGAPDQVRNLIERVPATGGSRTVLVEDALSPSVSRDGRQLAFLRATDATSDAEVSLWVADGDGRGARVVLDSRQFISLAFPRFSPAGDRLAFAGVGGPSSTGGAGQSWWTALMPRVALAHGLPWDLWEIRLDGSGLRRLTQLAEDDPSLAWSPDGRWLALQGGSGVYVLEVAATTLYQLSEAAGFGGIDWTP